MPITVIKKETPVEKDDKVKLPEFLAAEDMEIEDLIDAYAAMKARIDAFKDEMAPLSVLFKEYADALQKHFDKELEPDQSDKAAGKLNYLEVGEKAKSRTFKEGANEKIAEYVGVETFMEIASVKLGDCDKYLSGIQRDEVLEENQTGSRSLKIIPKKPAKKAK